jgi:hypothetical protein
MLFLASLDADIDLLALTRQAESSIVRPASDAIDVALAISDDVIRDFRVADAVYRFVTPMKAQFIPSGRLYAVPQLPFVRGEGSTITEARESWRWAFHHRFQELLGKREFEMEVRDRIHWESFQRFVDIAAYERETPIRMTLTGWITKARPYPCEIRWSDGSKTAFVPGMAPPEMMRLRSGQPIEATVAVDAVTREIQKIIDVRSVRAANVTRGDIDDLWESIPQVSHSLVVDER